MDLIDREALREALINRFTPIPDTVSIAYWPHDIVLEVLDAQTTPTCAGCEHNEYCPITCDNNPFVDADDRDAYYALTDTVWERGRRHHNFYCNRHEPREE